MKLYEMLRQKYTDKQIRAMITISVITSSLVERKILDDKEWKKLQRAIKVLKNEV